MLSGIREGRAMLGPSAARVLFRLDGSIKSYSRPKNQHKEVEKARSWKKEGGGAIPFS